MNEDRGMTFWVVWNPTRGLPRFQHESIEGATSEAKRLAREHPGEPFIVLQSVAKAQTKDPVVVTEYDQIPF